MTYFLLHFRFLTLSTYYLFIFLLVFVFILVLPTRVLSFNFFFVPQNNTFFFFTVSFCSFFHFITYIFFSSLSSFLSLKRVSHSYHFLYVPQIDNIFFITLSICSFFHLIGYLFSCFPYFSCLDLPRLTIDIFSMFFKTITLFFLLFAFPHSSTSLAIYVLSLHALFVLLSLVFPIIFRFQMFCKTILILFLLRSKLLVLVSSFFASSFHSISFAFSFYSRSSCPPEAVTLLKLHSSLHVYSSRFLSHPLSPPTGFYRRQQQRVYGKLHPRAAA